MMIAKAQAVVTPVPPLTSDRSLIPRPILLFRPAWPVTALATAVIVNLAWMSLLGYGLFKLVEPAFF
jgi:hypothetical protein